MPVFYAVKHVLRSWRLFVALLIGITLASTFFAGVDIKANVTAKHALDQDLARVYVDLVFNAWNPNLSAVQQAKEHSEGINGVTNVEIMSANEGLVAFDENGSVSTFIVRTVGIDSGSVVYDGWSNSPSEIGENETYVHENSAIAEKLQVGGFVVVNFSVYVPNRMEPAFVTLNLTVKGLARLDDKTYGIVNSAYYSSSYGWSDYPFYPSSSNPDLLIVDWHKTMLPLLNEIQALSQGSNIGSVSAGLLVWINRDQLINPWDTDTSMKNVRALKLQLQNEVSESGLNAYASNNLEAVLSNFQTESMMIRFTFTLVSIPIFFMAWYMGTTVSDVSFNLRRREIGLLSTKGFSRGQIMRIFATETLLLGLIGGVFGIALGFLLNPLFTQFSLDAFLNPQVVSQYTLILTVAFGVIMAFLSTYRSARRASRLAAVDALREYLPQEEVKAYRKRWPWIAFVLGIYKIIVFAAGVNMTTLLTGAIFAGGNFIISIVIGFMIGLDFALNYVGPLLFFWGFTKLLIQGSLKFQELATRAARFLGDLGTLATKNVRRNPARSAAIAFLIALIVSYGMQVTGQLASEQDYTIRRIYSEVGSDVSIYVGLPQEAPNISSVILANVSASVENSTIVYSFQLPYTNYGYLSFEAVEPESWVKTAYYESGWFSGNDVAVAFEKLSANKDSIVLEKGMASLLNLKVGDHIALNFGSPPRNLVVVGFFGQGSSGQQIFMVGSSSQNPSFISEDLYREINSTVSNPSATILLKLKGGINGTSVAQDIRNLGPIASTVISFSERMKEEQSNIVTVGILDAQRLGIMFAVLAASVGTALVSFVSMKERSREATIMSVKGLSYKQLLTMFLTENLAVVTFSVVLGLFVGSIVAYGNISASNNLSISTTSLIQHRFVFPLDAALVMTACVSLIFVSTILPILIVSRQYVTKLERMVRLR